jgi:hypothetical protein
VFLLVTLVDDPLFGALIVAAEVAFGVFGLIAASLGFTLLSVAMAAGAAWAVRTAPVRLSPKIRQRLHALRRKRLGRLLIPHHDRPVTTALAAAVFGSVAPIIVAALEPDGEVGITRSTVIVSGVAYGVAFASAYGLVGTAISAVA